MNNNKQSNEDIDGWNPMEDDYTNKAFNAYKEPTTAELRQWMLQKGEKAPSENMMANYRSPEGDVRLFVNGIPPDLTQEGIKGLFNQAGKVTYCKVIPKRDASRKDTFGFVGYQSYREAEKAIRLFDGFSLGENLRLKVNLAKRKAENIPYAESSLPAGLTEVNGIDESADWDTQAMNSAETDSAVTKIDTAEVANTENTINEVPMEEKPTVKQDNEPPEQNHDNHTHVQAAETRISSSDYSTPVTQSTSVPSSAAPQVNGQKVLEKELIPEAPCSVCGKNGRRRCSSCKIQYCSKDCQITDWPEHKKVCTWKSQKEIEVKQTNKDEPYIIDEDEMEISDPRGFMSHFGVRVRPDVVPAIAPNAFEQDNSLYLELDSEYPQYPVNGLRQPLERVQITEIQEPEENNPVVENRRSPLIEEIDPPNTNTRSPLIEEISSNDVHATINHTTSPLISELRSQQQEPLEPEQPLITEISSTSETVKNPVSRPLVEEIVTFNGTNNLKSKLTLITENTNDESGTTTITEIPATQATENRPPLITEIIPGESISQAPQSIQPINQNYQEEESSNVILNQSPVPHRYRFADIPHETLYPDNLYDIVVTSVSSPGLFWAQMFARDTLERQTFLYQTLNEVYANSEYENYVPMPGDVCVAQYSLDDNWYRCKVNFISNNGYVNVTHIDFGSSEDVNVTRIRRITSDIAAVRIQAIKCSLYFADGSPKEWSHEMIETFRATVLDVKCRVNCVEVKDSVCFVELYGANDKMSDMLQEMKNKFVLNPVALPEQPMDNLPSEPVPHVMSASPVSTDTKTTPTMSRNQPVPATIADQPSIPPDPMTTPSVSHDQPLVTNNATIPEQSSKPIAMTAPSTLPGQSGEATTTSITADQVSQISSSERVTTPVELSKMVSDISMTSLPTPTSETSQRETHDSTPHSTLSGQVPCPTSPVHDALPGLKTPPPLPTLSTPDTDRQGQPTSSLSSSDKFSSTLSSSSSEVDLKRTLSPSSPRHGNFTPKQKFEAVVSSVVSPIEFKAVLSEPELLAKLDELHTKLQEYCNSTPCDPSIMYKYHDVCAVRSAKDMEWHRARITFSSQNNSYSVHLLDMDTKERVSTDNMRPVPDWVQALPPRCIICSLGGITKRSGMTNFGKDASEKFASLVLNKKFTCKEISRKKNSYLIDLLDELGQPSVARELIDGGFADAFVRKPFENMELNASFLSCRMAISSARLPPPGELFQANVSQYESPGHFFIQLKDEESQQTLDKICQEMNGHYAALPPPTDWQAREGQHCAAFFRSSWLRASVKSINEDKVATIFCVDFGNVEIVPHSALRPLEPQFSSLPHCALHCSLAYISPPEGNTEWTKEAVEFARMKMPLSSTVNVSLAFKGKTILFIDVFLQNNDSLSRLLISKSLASKRNNQGSPAKEERFFNQHDSKGQFLQKSPRQRNRDKQPTPKEMAISAAKLPQSKECFKVFVTHITSPGCFAVQVANFELASKVAALHNQMNSHYNTNTYPPHQPTLNEVCASQFTVDNSWYRAWIEKVVDDKVHVYYVDYGNSEVLDASRLRPLEPQFRGLPYAAITCGLGSVTSQGEWSPEAKEFFSSKVPVFAALEVKIVFKKYECIFLEISDPQDPTTTVNKTLVANNLAVWMFDKKPRREFSSSSPPGAMPIDVREKKLKIDENTMKSLENDLSMKKNIVNDSEMPRQNIENPRQTFEDTGRNNAENQVKLIENQERPKENPGRTMETPQSFVKAPLKFTVDSVPIIAVPHGDLHNSMVCDVKPTGIVSFQMLTKEIEDFASLGTNISVHCNQVDNTPYYPSVRELCFVRFTEDKEWYRAVVDAALPSNKFKVTFVDYGNEDIVTPEAIRVMNEKFLALPRQAYTGPLKGIASTNQTPLPDDVINALKQQLLDKRSFVLVDRDGVELFDVGPNGDPSKSVNAKFIDILYPQVPTEIDTEFAALVTEVHNTREIWLQQQHQHDVIKTLMDDVNLYCSNTSSMTSPPSQGDLLFAKHSFYNRWYRARIDEWKPPMASVRFVDYGYSEQVTVDKLRPPRSDLLRLPPQAVKCYLVRVVQGNPGADDFIKQILNREFIVKIVEKKGDSLGIELEDYGVPNGPLNINDYLIGFGYEA